jgi:type VI secretion system lysozyme-like protein
MRNSGIDSPLEFTVFDRLLLGEWGDALQPGESDLTRLRDFVLRDLRWLLNTRQTLKTVERYPELRRSAMAYGFTDITSLGRDSPLVRARLLSQIEETLALFEPRLTALRVSLASVPGGARHQLRFVVAGTLRADPVPVQFQFDTVIDKLKGGVDVTDTSEGTGR